MSQHNKFVAPNLSFFAALENCGDIKSICRDKDFCLLFFHFVATFLAMSGQTSLGFFFFLVATVFSFVATKFLTVALSVVATDFFFVVT